MTEKALNILFNKLQLLQTKINLQRSYINSIV